MQNKKDARQLTREEMTLVLQRLGVAMRSRTPIEQLYQMALNQFGILRVEFEVLRLRGLGVEP